MYKIAVLVSGGGSNLGAIIDSINLGKLNCTIEAVISDREGAYGIERAKDNNINTYIFNKKQYGDRLSTEILKVLNGKVDLIVLAGFLSILKGEILTIFKDKIINIHPSLLPLFCGSNMYGIKVHEKAIEAGAKVSGCTVHYVEHGIDTGTIILQKAVPVYYDDTPRALQNRVLEQEHKALPEVIGMKIKESEARIMKKRALISVYDKSNVVELASFLVKREFEIISTGGTYKFLKENNIPVTEVSEVTDFEEILDGRVKTLHPKVLGGILAMRDNKKHMEVIKHKGIAPIDMVVVNLYPFFHKVREDLSFEDKVEFIDIGGPTMIRAGAKNFQDVVVLTEVEDYKKIVREIEEKGDVTYITRKRLAGKVFNLMSAYDAAIANFLLGTEDYEEYLTLSYKKIIDLRYGENPHQSAAYYVATDRDGAMKDFVQLNGKELSYNNIKDMDIAWKVVSEFEEVMCCSVKHNTPCGAAIGEDLIETYLKTYECDPISIFGGVVAFNKKVDKVTALELVKTFLEIVIAPGFEDDALVVLSGKKNLRVIVAHSAPQNEREIVSVDGGILVQSRDDILIENLNIVTEKAPSEKDMTDMIFGMKIVKFVKSNAIVVVGDGMAKGIGGGQVNRIWSAIEALGRAKDGVILASDAFFPFKDVVEKAAEYNIRGIIQPGGSIRDKESIESCNILGIPMVFTGIRHFKH